MMLRFAMVSKWHVHAAQYARFVTEQPDAEIRCVYDEDEQRGRAWAEELKVPFVGDYDEVLKRDDVDAVLICTPTNRHLEVMVKAANAKKHIFTEKVLAFTVADCDTIIRAVEQNGVKFSICFPHRCMPRNLFVERAVKEGAIGKVTALRARNVHDGALNNWLPDYWYDPKTTGGGAMMDLGAHPMYLARWILGRPTRIQSMFSYVTNREVEDSAISTIEFEGGAVAISETSLVAPRTQPSLEVYGTEGAIRYDGDDVQIKTNRLSDLVEQGWMRAKLPEALPHPIRQFIDGVLSDQPIRFGLDEARQLTELMENAYIAHREHREVAFTK